MQHVVAAVIVNRSQRILLAKRPLDRHQGGLWEFPGGKVEHGEGARAALARELHEELGIVVQDARPLIKICHEYPDKSVLLDVWRVSAFDGEPHGREGQPIEWVSAQALPDREFPAANRPIVTAARLPSIYLLTPEPDDPVKFLGRLETLLAEGIGLVQLRAKTLGPAAYSKLATQVMSLCAGTETRLLLNAPPMLAEQLGAAGVHLTSAALMAFKDRPLGREQWVAASCHSAEELEHACRIGVDFIVLAPVSATATHPGARPLGWRNLRQLAERATVPVYALGGMRLDDIATAWEHGCQGIASISALWSASHLPRHLQL